MIISMVFCNAGLTQEKKLDKDLVDRMIKSMEEEQRREELIREYVEMRRILMNYKNRYKVPKIDVEEMEEDEEHVIIVNPDGAEICLGKVITD